MFPGKAGDIYQQLFAMTLLLPSKCASVYEKKTKKHSYFRYR